ncbi:NAD-dependent epimerase/dehydratase family protein [Haloarchaeobius baliensis]|uniref:NAD-dependent epimerase/dehydratase family protein n=1 Tax=Haloarchaeobius baliensis TaxID=1670458 RepID=UPI003F884D9D
MTTETVLVTGGAGFIGSAMAERLLDTGREVVVVDNLSTGGRENVPAGATFVAGNTADPATYEAVESVSDVDAVFHLAGQSSGEASFDDPVADLESHVIGTFELLRWCRERDIDRLLYASSMSVYGDPRYLPVDESHPSDPKTFYAAGKRGAEAYVRLFDNLGMETTVFRLFSVYGPGQNMANMKQGMVSIFLSFCLDDGPIVVKGPLDRFRDFVYVDDVVDAWVRALDEPATDGETYNLGRGERVTVDELLETMGEVYDGDPGPVEVTDGTPGDQFGIVADATRLRRDLDWEPSVGLREGLTRMLRSATGEPDRHGPVDS